MDEINKMDIGGFLQSPQEQEKDVKKKVQIKMNKNCGQCDYQFETTKELIFHLRNSPGHVPKCVHCDTNFADFNNYVKHVGKFHMQEAEIVCQECGKTSKTHEQQRLHWNSVHKVEEGLYCNLCGRECQNMAKLRKHTKFCLTKDPDIAAQERIKNEAENEKVREQLQTWTHEQYLEWQQRKEEAANKPKPSTPAKKKKEQNGGKTRTKRRTTDDDESFLNVKKLKPEEDAQLQAEKNFIEHFLTQQQQKMQGDDHSNVVKDESDIKGVKEECPSEDSDNNNDNDTTNDDTFEDTFNDSSFNDDSHDFNMNSDDENIIKAEVKLEAESGDETLDFDTTNDDREESPLLTKSEVKEEAERKKRKKERTPRKNAFPTRPLTEEEEQDLKCKECDHTFKRLKYLKTHIRIIHGPDAGEQKTPSPRKTPKVQSSPRVVEYGDFPCEFCGKTYKTKPLLAGHVHQVHTKIKTCKLCKEPTTDLAKHRQEFHPETVIDPEQGLTCRDCGKSFKTIKILRAHLRLQHGTEKKVNQTILPPYTSNMSLVNDFHFEE